MSDCNEPDGITIAEYDEVSTPIVQRQTLLEVQQTDQDVGNQSRKMSVETLVGEISPQIQQYADDAITELDSGIQGRIDALDAGIDEKIVTVNDRIDTLDAGVDTRISAIDHLDALDVPGLLDEIRPTVETWSSGGGSRVNVLRDNQDITLPYSPEIGASINILVQATTPGQIHQIAGTTLRNTEHYNATGDDGFLRLRNNQRLEVAYVADELVEDKGYAYLPDLLDTPVTAEVSSMALSPDGRYIGLGLTTAPWFAIYRIDGMQFRKVADFNAGASPLAFAFHPENNDIHMGLPGTNSHVIIGFDGASLTFKEGIRANNNALTYSISFSPDGRYKAEGHSGGTVTITDLTTNTEVDHPWTSTGATDVVHSLAFSPSPPAGMDQLLAIGHFGDPCMSFLSFSDGVITKLQRPRAIRHRAEAIKSMAWSHDGELLAVNLSGNEIVVYDMTGGKKNIATVLTELTTESGDKNSGTVFYSVAFSKFKHLGVSWGYNASHQLKYANIYNFENNVVPDTYFKQLSSGASPEDVPISWTVGGGYFLFGGGAGNFRVYHALKFTQGVWFVSRLDGPEIQASDFSSIGSPAETPEEEIKPAETPEEETAEAETPEEESKPAKKKRRKKKEDK